MEATTIHSAEAKRWLNTAVKLLTTRDLYGTRSFAIRARESYPRLDAADEIIAIADTLIAGESRINNQHDYYTILQVPRNTQNLEIIASQYRRLAILLNPQKNQLPYSDEAFRFVSEAWSVLSNPAKKVVYDSELNVRTQFELGTGSTQLRDRQPFLQKHQPQQPVRRSSRTKEGRPVAAAVEEDSPSVNNVTDSIRSITRPGRPARQSVPTTRAATAAQSEAPSNFWTACPYCYFLYEYPKVYEDCALRCQNCKRAFHAAMIPSPPVTGTKDAYFCCWGFFPLGFSGKDKINAGSSNWNPISAMFACPLPSQGKKNNDNRSSSPKFVYHDEDVIVEVSDESDDSDDEWGRSGRRKRARNSKGKGSVAVNNIPKRAPSERLKRGNNKNVEGMDNAGNGQVFDSAVASGAAPRTDSSKKAVASASNAKKKGKAKWGRLDLNVEFSNEIEEPAPGMSEGNGAGNQEGDNIEGIGFFEGLDEFLSSLPILNVVGDDKVKAT